MRGFKSLFILPVIIIVLAVPVKASTRDFVNIKTGEIITASDWRNSDATFDDLIDKLSDDTTSGDYAIEFGGKYYQYDGLLNALVNKPIDQSTSDAFANALKDTSLIITVDVSNDFDVIDIY